MANKNPDQPSFSENRKWFFGLNVAVAIAALFALVVMANYLAVRYYTRLPLTSRRQVSIAPQTARVLRSITNEVKITVFFDSRDSAELRGLIAALLKEYNYLNRKIIVKNVDPSRNPAQAESVLAAYKKAGSLKDKNFVILDYEGRTKTYYESDLADFETSLKQGGQPNEYEKRMVGFRGEMVFTTAIFNLVNAREYKVCFLQDHGENNPDNSTSPTGYAKFADALKEKNNVRWEKISLLGTNDIPADCQMLVIAGPMSPYGEQELAKIENYLKQGGRAFILLNSMIVSSRLSGVERILAQWGIGVAADVVSDPQFSIGDAGDLLTAQMDTKHPIMKSLTEATEDLRVRLFSPRLIGRTATSSATPNATEIKALAASSRNATESSDIRDGVVYQNPSKSLPAPFALIVAIEQGGVKGVSSERGAMRMVIVGDSLCMDNQLIETYGNHYFAANAANWLLDRPQVLFEGLVPSPLKEYKLMMTRNQQSAAQWLLLVAMPAAILFIGALVWLRRRR